MQAAREQTAFTRAQVTDAERTLAFNVGVQFVAVLLAESALPVALRDLQGFQQIRVDISTRNTNSRRATHRGRRLSQDQVAASAIPDRRRSSTRLPGKGTNALVTACVSSPLGYNAVPADFDVIGDLAYEPIKGTLEDLQRKAMRERPDLSRLRNWGQRLHRTESCWPRRTPR